MNGLDTNTLNGVIPMTDNEIVKALECCSSEVLVNLNCSHCPYQCPNCMTILYKDALALINRQKAEIDRQDKEIERLNGILENYAFEYGTTVDKERFLKKARAEAVKEFAERVKEKIRTMSRIVVYDEDIDNLVKEFTEEKADE